MELRASEFGMCIRALVAQQLGFEGAPFPEQLAERGNQHEVECIETMQNDGWWISPGQEEVEFLGITGHLDGLCHQLEVGQNRVLEVKSPTSWAKFQDAYKTDTWSDSLAVRYAWQTSIYMHATGLECVVACVDDGRVKTFVIETPIHDEEAIRARKAGIENAVFILGESALQNKNLVCDPAANPFFCPYASITGCRDKATVDDPDIDYYAGQYEMWRVKADQAKKEMDAARKRIEQALGQRDQVRTKYVTVTRYSQAGPAKWDTDLMVADGVDVDRYRKPGAPSTRMKITMRGED